MIAINPAALRAEFFRLMEGFDDDLHAAELKGNGAMIHTLNSCAANLRGEWLLARRDVWPNGRWIEALCRCAYHRKRVRLLLGPNQEAARRPSFNCGEDYAE